MTSKKKTVKWKQRNSQISSCYYDTPTVISLTLHYSACYITHIQVPPKGINKTSISFSLTHGAMDTFPATLLVRKTFQTHTHTLTHTHTHTRTYVNNVHMHILQVFNTKENGYHFYDRMFGRNLLTADSAMQGTVYYSKLQYMPHILS